MFDYDPFSKRAAGVLDQYDLTSAIKNIYGVEIYKLYDILSQVHPQVAQVVHSLCPDELADYLHVRYGMRLEEVSTTYVWYNDRFVRNQNQCLDELEVESNASKPNVESVESD